MRISVLVTGICLSMVGSCFAQISMAAMTRIETCIPSQALGSALKQLAKLDHIQVLYLTADVRDLRTPGASGTLTAAETLTRLLSGTGLKYRYVDANAVSIVSVRRPVEVKQDTSVKVKSSGPSGTDQRDNAVTRGEGLDPKQTDLAQPPKALRVPRPVQPALQQVTITGTHIRGTKTPMFAVKTFTRDEIDQSGLGTVAAFLQTVPSNFSGGMSETTDAAVAGGGQSSQNATAGTGINLRGLGSDATLVLLDGHRLAPADVYGNFVDVSMIPVSAVRSIDVVTDGASAIYGSDAVGGVVNIVTRQHFNGVETRARFGSDDHNDTHESKIGQSFGHDWGSGSVLASYEFSAVDRTFTTAVPPPFTLLPEQVRQSAIATLSDSVSPGVSLYSDAYFSHRATNSYLSVLGQFQQHVSATVDSYGGILGVQLSLTDTTQLDVSGDYTVGAADSLAFDLPQITVPISNQKATSTLATEEAVLNGPLWSLPAGRILYAVGVQLRQESYSLRDLFAQNEFGPSRNISSGFVELRIPALNSTEEFDRPKLLEISLADREDHYSDVGSTNNATVGIRWRPASHLQLRATYGTSFVAPLLNYTNPVPSEVVAFNTTEVPGSAPPGTGPINVLITAGGSANLKPQTARTWTLGGDWRSPETHSLRVAAAYYNIRFTNRINSLQSAGYNAFLALPIANILGPRIVRFRPSAALIQQLESSPNFQNFGAIGSIADIGAVVDSRELNLSDVATDGVDLAVSRKVELGRELVEPGIDATYIFHLNTRFTSLTPVARTVNTIYNPTRARVRARLLISREPFSLLVFTNFINAYTNNTTIPFSRIASWTTFDLSASYSCDKCSGHLGGLTATLGVLNVLNRAPPFAENGNGFAVNYDGANANPLGRYVALNVGVQW